MIDPRSSRGGVTNCQGIGKEILAELIKMTHVFLQFTFEMTKDELENWRRQFGTSKKVKMGLRIPPFVFTELGIAMLSSVLNSDQAIEINISIMRIFSKLRSFLLMKEKLNERIDRLESGANKVFKVVFQRLDNLEQATPSLKPNRKKIGLTPKG